MPNVLRGLFAQINVINITKKLYTVTWASLINLLENGDLRFYYTVYDYPQITLLFDEFLSVISMRFAVYFVPFL